MSVIIQDAKRLLDGATPGPWITGGKDESGNIYIGNPSEYGNLVATSGICDADLIAAAPELAQALAEEEYQYGVTYTGLNHGGQHFQWVESTGDTEWDKETLQLLVKRWKKRGQSPKIVRRRVSPVEVVNDNRFTR